MKIVIVEDENIIARRLLRMTKAFFGDKIVQLTHFDSLSEGLNYIAANNIDLLLLDLNLNGEDGFDILQNMVAASFDTIIISAYKVKAITAFEFGVLDFVPKPFNEKRLNQAFLRITNRLEKKEIGIKYLAIQKKGRQQLVSVDDILYIKGARIYTELFLKNGETAIHNKSLDKLAQLLPDSFERIHKSYLLDMTQIKEVLIESGGKYAVILHNGDQLPVSRSKYKGLKKKWLDL